MKLTRVAIVGAAGTGKSFLVNSILGYPAVKHEVSAGPVTLESIVPPAKKEGIHVTTILGCVGILLLSFMFSYNVTDVVNDTLTDKQLNLIKKSFEEDYVKLKEDEEIRTTEIRTIAEATKNLRISNNKYEVKFNEHLEENRNLKDKETNVKSNIEKLRKENKDLTKSVSENKTKFIVLKEENTNLRDRETTVNSNIEQIDIENKHQNNLASEDERKFNDLKEENNNLKDMEDTRKANIDQLKNENKILKKSVDYNDQTFIELAEENTKLKDKFIVRREHSERPEALQALANTLNSSAVFLEKARNLTGEGDDGYFKEKELDVLAKKIAEVGKWRDDKMEEQKATPLSEMPKLTVNMIISKIIDLDSEVKFLVSTAKMRKAEKEREKRKKEAEEKKAKEEAKKKAKRS